MTAVGLKEYKEFKRPPKIVAKWTQMLASNTAHLARLLKAQQYPGIKGGPVMKDKAFFFFSYGGLRQITDAVFTGAITPTAAERLGDFTADTFTVYTPGTAHVAANQVDGTNSSPNCLVAKLNCIPQALLDTTIANLDNVSNTFGSSIPPPNGALNPAKGGGAYSGLFPIPATENEYLAKYATNIERKDHQVAP